MLSACLDPGYLYSISEWTIPQKEIRESNQSYVLYVCRATTYIKSNCFYPGSLFGSFQINKWTIPQKEIGDYSTNMYCTAVIHWTNNRTVSIRVPFFCLSDWTNGRSIKKKAELYRLLIIYTNFFTNSSTYTRTIRVDWLT
jgi:hypothetical protein